MSIEAIFERYVKTFATRNVEDIGALHAQGGTFWLRAGARPVHGREMIGRTFAGFFEQWPEFGFEQYRVLFTERSWILDWAATAVLTTPAGEKRPIRFDCLDVVDVGADGLVVRKDTFIDLVQVQAARASASM